jgi:hypothetical protein
MRSKHTSCLEKEESIGIRMVASCKWNKHDRWQTHIVTQKLKELETEFFCALQAPTPMGGRKTGYMNTFSLVSYNCLTVATKSSGGVVPSDRICSTWPLNRKSCYCSKQLNSVGKILQAFDRLSASQNTCVKRFSLP